MHPAETALLLESLPPAQRALVWELVDAEAQGDVLVELSEEVRSELLAEMQPRRTGRRGRGPGGGRPRRPAGGTAGSGHAAGAEVDGPAGPRAALHRARLPGGLGRRPDEHGHGDGAPGRADRGRAALPAHARRAAGAHGLPVRRGPQRPLPRRAAGGAAAHRRSGAHRQFRDGPGGRADPAGGAGQRSRAPVRDPRPAVGRGRGRGRQAARAHHGRRRGGRRARTGGAPGPRRRGPRGRGRRLCRRQEERAAPRAVARHQPADGAARLLGRRPVRGHDRESGRARGADAGGREHGRHRRHADRHADHPRHRARPGAAVECALAVLQGTLRSAR